MADLNEKKSERDSVWDLPIGEGLRCAAELRSHLSIDERKYLLFAGQVLDDCRSYVLYIALDEVKKASIHLMRLREVLDEKEAAKQKHAEDDRLARLVTTSILEEQQMRVRRLLELLVTLIPFSTTNEQPHYRHLLLLGACPSNSFSQA